MPRTCFVDGTPATTTLDDDDDDDDVGSGESIESGNIGMCVFGVPAACEYFTYETSLHGLLGDDNIGSEL